MTALCAIALGAACHSHDDDAGASASALPPAGSSGAFVFDPSSAVVRAGETTDLAAQNVGGGAAQISSWMLIQGPGATLVPRPGDDVVRLIAGDAGYYVVEATNAQGETGTYGFDVIANETELTVTEVIAGDDNDDVFARLATSGEDIFIADRIGGPAAPQQFARATRGGTREVETTLPFKVSDLSADSNGRVTVSRPATTLTGALVRYDRDLNEDATFEAPDIAPAEWSDRLAVRRNGETVVATTLDGGRLLVLDVGGDPAGGSLAMSYLPLPFAVEEIVDMTSDWEGAIYVATETEIARVTAGGVVDTMYWTPETQTAIRAIESDDRGVVYVALQDESGGQCGSLRRLNWLGIQFARLSDFQQGAEFAARKILDPQDIGVYEQGAWRLYDDTVVLNPATPTAGWILAGNIPQ